MTDLDLMLEAAKARTQSYSPYSEYSVGAALLCEDGTVYTGCNIENASYTPTICAERTAFFKAVSEGKRGFQKIAIIGGRHDEVSHTCAPCGVCRQVMSEFCGEDFEVLWGTLTHFHSYRLAELFPSSFSKAEL